MEEKLLERIAIALEAVAANFASDTTQPLGFGESPRATFIYANNNRAETWYSLDEDRRPQELPSTLTGYIQDLRVEKKERQGKEVTKMLATIKADRTYIIESGSDTGFSRCLFSALAIIPPSALRSPISIEVRPGEKSLFCTIYAGGDRVDAPWDAESDFRSRAYAAMDAVRIANRGAA